MQQILAPHLFQSLEILQMPLLDLQALIRRELAENPTLEVHSNDSENHVEIDQVTAEVERDADEKFDNEFAKLVQLDEEWGDSFYGRREIERNAEAEERYQYMMDSLSEKTSLQDQLMEQLALSGLSEKEKKIGELIIGNINDDGYLTVDLEDLLFIPSFSKEMFEKILSIIQDFDPPGVGARSLSECLLLQLKRQGRGDSQEAELVANHLNLLGAHKYEEIAKAMGISLERVKELARSIAALDPKPGRNFSAERVEYVIPEIIVEKRDGEYVVIQNRKPYPSLFINRKYIQMMKNPNTSKEVKKYIREKITKSKQFIQSIDQRMQTIYRIAVEIVRIQRDFFEYGVMHLKPLTMKTVAETLGLHETTISRATTSKFMQTPQGIFEMKYFFRPGIATTSGEAVSNESVKAALVQLIASEDKTKPYSDSKLAKLLEEQGIKIARRTVAKYRDQLKILPSHLRKSI